jgi:lysine-N-methylase
MVGEMVTMPAYMARFQCIGTACEDSCCNAGWNVPVDRRAYELYQGLTDPELGPELRRLIVPLEVDASDQDCARIVLREPDRGCPFLTADRLCGIQLKAGPQLLADVCATYPRVALLIDGERYRAAKLSCPEATRLALLAPDAVTLVQRCEAPGSREPLAANVTTSSMASGDPMAFLPLLRTLAVDLLQRRAVSIETRLVALGISLGRISTAVGSQSWSSSEQRQSSLAASGTLSGAAIRAAFRWRMAGLLALEHGRVCLPPRAPAAVDLLGRLRPLDYFPAGDMPRYLTCVEKITEALGLAAETSRDDAAARYEAAARGFYEPYMAQRPYIMENLLISCIYASSFPFAAERTILDEYLALLMTYVVTKVHLIGAAAGERNLSDEIVVEVVHVLQRAIDHNAGYRVHAVEVLKERGSGDVASLPLLTLC